MVRLGQAGAVFAVSPFQCGLWRYTSAQESNSNNINSGIIFFLFHQGAEACGLRVAISQFAVRCFLRRDTKGLKDTKPLVSLRSLHHTSHRYHLAILQYYRSLADPTHCFSKSQLWNTILHQCQLRNF